MTSEQPTYRYPDTYDTGIDTGVFVARKTVDGILAGNLDLSQHPDAQAALQLRRRTIISGILAGMALNAGPPVIPGQRQPSPES